MPVLICESEGGRHFTVRMTRQPREDVVHVIGPKPVPARVYPIHDRRHVSTDMPQSSLPMKGT